MNGPSAAWYANVWAPLAGTTSTTPIGPGPAPNATGYPSIADIAGMPPPPASVPAPPPPAPPPAAAPGEIMSKAPPPQPNATPVPPAPPAAAPPPTPKAPAEPMGGESFPLRRVSGGAVPAHEVERRGPSLLAAQGVRNQASEDTIARVGERNQDMAEQEYGLALDQERMARAREAAAQQSMAERQQELAERQQDFEDSVAKMGKLGTLNRDRWWASRSTGQKIAGFIEVALSGFNRAPSMIMKRIDDDVKAQEFAFYAAKDQAQAAQTAFGLAMQKYNNADAARAMAKAASLDVVQAQLSQMGAKWKGTEAANRADMALAALQDEKMMQIANGVQFVPARAGGAVFVDPETGVTYTNEQAAAFDKLRRERNFGRQTEAARIGGQLVVEEKKAEHAAAKDSRQHLVTLPNGDTVDAMAPNEATTLRGLATAVSSAQQLVSRAKEIRQGTAWRIPGSAERAQLEAIQSELTLAFKDRGQLGALSGPDMDLARSATGDITSQMPNAEAKLDSFARATDNALKNRVKTIPGAPSTAKGELPPEAAASFKSYGKK